MKLIELTAEQLSALYESELKAAFPPQELKPLKAILNLMAEKKYQALGLYDGDELVGYALLWLEPGIPFALLDYLGTIEGRRSQGLGTIMLDLLAGYYKDYRGIFGEAEAPEGGSPEGRSCAGAGSASICATGSDTAAMTAPSLVSTTRP